MTPGKKRGSPFQIGPEFIRCTRSMSGKRIAMNRSPEKSQLETLPQEVFVKIFRSLEYADMRSLFHVSKAIREAVIAAICYTPEKRTFAICNVGDVDVEEMEVPNAPEKLCVHKVKLSNEKKARISVALFASPGKQA